MTLVFEGGTYEPNDDDRLWLLRAVAAEGPVAVDVARALVNGFVLVRSRGYASSLSRFVRAYAQPVNPRWFQTGDLFQKAYARASADAKPALLSQAKRRESEHSMRVLFPAAVELAVSQALQRPFPSDVTDYAAPDLDATRKGYVARSPAVPGRNRLWTRRAGWAGYAVDVATGPAGGGAVVAVLLVAAAWFLLRGRA